MLKIFLVASWVHGSLFDVSEAPFGRMTQSMLKAVKSCVAAAFWRRHASGVHPSAVGMTTQAPRTRSMPHAWPDFALLRLSFVGSLFLLAVLSQSLFRFVHCFLFVLLRRA